MAYRGQGAGLCAGSWGCRLLQQASLCESFPQHPGQGGAWPLSNLCLHYEWVFTEKTRAIGIHRDPKLPEFPEGFLVVPWPKRLKISIWDQTRGGWCAGGGG